MNIIVEVDSSKLLHDEVEIKEVRTLVGISKDKQCLVIDFKAIYDDHSSHKKTLHVKQEFRVDMWVEDVSMSYMYDQNVTEWTLCFDKSCETSINYIDEEEMKMDYAKILKEIKKLRK